jgi:Tol biopolymer transport system component
MVTREPGDYRKPKVSPDGKFVLVTSDNGDLLLADVASGDSRKLMEAEQGSWSPDGTQLAVLRRVDGRTIAVIVTPKGEVTRELKTVRSTKSDIAWSPDGDRVAWTDTSPEGRGIRVYDLEKGTDRLITVAGRSPSWSPDSSMLIVETERGQAPENQTLAIFDAKNAGRSGPLMRRTTTTRSSTASTGRRSATSTGLSPRSARRRRNSMT